VIESEDSLKIGGKTPARSLGHAGICYNLIMFGIVSLIIAISLGLWLFALQGSRTVENSDETQVQDYADMLEAARAIPGVPRGE
jgi:hypothetical protein